jgi:hypothetical protein
MNNHHRQLNTEGVGTAAELLHQHAELLHLPTLTDVTAIAILHLFFGLLTGFGAVGFNGLLRRPVGPVHLLGCLAHGEGVAVWLTGSPSCP